MNATMKPPFQNLDRLVADEPRRCPRLAYCRTFGALIGYVKNASRKGAKAQSCSVACLFCASLRLCVTPIPIAGLFTQSLRFAFIFFAMLLFAGCKDRNGTATIPVKSWRTWMLPTDGAVQPTPRSLATGPHDELAVMDTAGRVLIYDANGALLRQWKMLDVQFGKPEGIVWLKDDRIVVCDTHYRRLVWFDQQGHVLKTLGQHGKGRGEFIYPVGICKDTAENLYVCEYGGNDRVQVFTREGEWLREFGSPGTGAGQFQRPSGLVWHAGKVFVVDAINNRVHIFTEEGKYLSLLGAGSDGKSALIFNLPYDIALAPDGSLYVIEYGAGRLSRVSLDGTLLGRYGKTGRGDAEFATPWGLTVDSRMRVLVADTMNRRIVCVGL